MWAEWALYAALFFSILMNGWVIAESPTRGTRITAWLGMLLVAFIIADMLFHIL